MNTLDLRAALKARYSPPAWATLCEVGNATGHQCNRHADVVAMSLWPSRGLHLHGFELKISRSDWQRELKKPEKAESIFGFCDRWWLVAGHAEIVRDGELPPTWGLLVWNGKKLVTSVEAPALDPKPVDRSFLAALMRRMNEQSPAKDALAAQFEAGQKAEKDRRRNAEHWAERDLQQLRERLTRFRELSGVDFEQCWNEDELAAAVGIYMKSGAARFQNRLNDLLRQSKTLTEQIEKALQEPAA